MQGGALSLLLASVLTLVSPTPYPGTDRSSFYYKEENIDETIEINGATIQFWDPTDSHDQAPFEITPPKGARVKIPGGGIFPDFGSFWLPSDTYYTVVQGEVIFENQGGDKLLGPGDTYWVMAGHPHGPIICEAECKLLTLSSSRFVLKGENGEVPSDDSASVQDPNLTKERVYIAADGEWSGIGIIGDDISTCAEGEAQTNMNPPMENTPALFMVQFHTNCAILPHHHANGAIYAVTEGAILFEGDSDNGEPIAVNAGEVRWVQPGKHYGHEYPREPNLYTRFNVIGFDIIPTSEYPPPGPYKMQKTVQITHIFDEL